MRRFVVHGISASAAAHLVAVGCLLAGSVPGKRLPEAADPVHQINSIRLTATSPSPAKAASVTVDPPPAHPPRSRAGIPASRSGAVRRIIVSPAGTGRPPHGTVAEWIPDERETVPEPAELSRRETRDDAPDVPARHTTLQREPPATTPAVATAASVPSERLAGARSPKPPHAVYNPNPEYPAHLQAAHVEGVVLVRIRLADSGAVESAVVERSSGTRELDQSALDALRRWRFEPWDPRSPTIREFDQPCRFQIIRDRQAR